MSCWRAIAVHRRTVPRLVVHTNMVILLSTYQVWDGSAPRPAASPSCGGFSGLVKKTAQPPPPSCPARRRCSCPYT